jgi:predicted RNA methylase
MFSPHPYEVLAVEPTATNAEILQAFALAMQRKQYPPDVLAKARKVLMDPNDRPLLDYLWGTWRKRSDVQVVDSTLLDRLDAEVALLDRAIQDLSIDHLTPASMDAEIAAADHLLGKSLQNFSY